MKRSEVAEKYKWNTADLYPSDEDWEKDFATLSDMTKAAGTFKGKLKDKEVLLAALKYDDEAGALIDRLASYAMMRQDENNLDDKYVGMKDRIMGVYAAFAAELSYFSPELSALPAKKLEEFIADPELADYDYYLGEVLRRKKYILSDKEERILALASDSLNGFHNVFTMIDNVDVPFPEVSDGEGGKVRLSHGVYSVLLSHADRAVREEAFKGLYGAYSSLISTLSANYAGNVKGGNLFTRAKGFGSSLERAMYGDNVPKAVYTNLIKAVGDNIKPLHDYVKYRASALGGEIHMYDMYVPIVPDAQMKVDYETAAQYVKEGLKPLGEEYAGLLERAFSERWIDVYETENKRSGAYSTGVYDCHPYVLLNYEKTTHDIFTIAHELGHAMHTYYSSSAQPRSKADYAIFVAEVASTVNEVLLLKHFIAKETDPKMKKYLLSYYLDMFRTTLFRQTMFAEFEAAVHDMDYAGQPLTKDSMCELYYDLNKKYYGEGVIHDEEIKYEWARIPHFYRAFYVYKYATGLTSAVSIARGILSGDKAQLKAYFEFLKAGGNRSPYEILKLTGVDLATSAPYESAMAEFRETLMQLKSMD